ncbi:hypothetical protein NYQ10_14090 [Flavobacterium johnsoniae]|uniref:hypothetical protein n=1 Tax=Flavobacterium johnsoniae TaxID=986 RepID=UPI0025AFDC67|nr:hypothetical protein [Flavobacterium johnsoniae]WJS93221.1 hypothetical protein NYQ10_14090 [Flavobacterium johnsoniae]
MINLKRIEDYILNYKNENPFIFYLKIIFLNLQHLKQLTVTDFLLENEKFSVEFELEEVFLKLELDNFFINIQINGIEQYYILENNFQIEELINDFFKGNYIIKRFVNKNGKVRFLKLIWINKNLKKYNIKFKIGWLNCKNNIKNIYVEKGVILLKV